ncbi:MAG: ribose-5-phosphate isomerase RpiA [Pseudomonadota bacterium]
MDPRQKKIAAARQALDYIRPGTAIGLGTGSTAAELVSLLGERVQQGFEVIAVPTSEATRQQAESLGIPLTTLDQTPTLDVTIDGADELDHALRLIKGGGGALLREKIVACASCRMVVIADETKLVKTLGKYPLPIEVIPFGLAATQARVAALARTLDLNGDIKLRSVSGGEPFVTDNSNFILDCAFGAIPQSEALAAGLNSVPGVVDNGLFIGIADTAIIASDKGVEVISSPNNPT